MNRGVLYAAGAYILWGFFPIYWKALQHVPATEILSHRMVWSLVLVAILLFLSRQREWIQQVRQDRRIFFFYTTSAALLSINWLTYIWGVNAGFVIETSLGYFINPLVSVLLGVVFLGERLRRGQWTAVLLAFAGVVYLTISYGRLPWIALTLAVSFAFYGLIRKKAPLPSLPALGIETAVLTPIALGYIVWLQATGAGALMSDPSTTVLLMLCGVVTAVPLLLFGAGARRIHLSTIGLLQYLAPTIQFLLGVYLYSEPFSRNRLIGFVMIWLALILYTTDALRHHRHRRLVPLASSAD